MADREAMAAFCYREHARLVGALTLFVGERDVAEELAQDALVRACQRWEHLERMESPRAWLHTVGMNLARSWVRRRAAERRARARHDARPAPADSGADTADRIAVRAAVAALPERQRMAVVLRYYADLPAAQVADRMGCAEATVRALTHQAISALRRSGGLLEEVVDA